MIRRRLVRAIARTGWRLHREADAAARARGLQVRAGKHGLVRQYRDPRWDLVTGESD